MKGSTQLLVCCGPGCRTPVHPESGEGFISSKYNRPFCSVDCEYDFDPDVYRQEHPLVPTVSKAQKPRFDAEDVFPTLYGSCRDETIQDSDEERHTTTQRQDNEALVEPPQDFATYFAKVKEGLPTEPIYVLR